MIMQPLHQLIRSVTTQLYTNDWLKSLLIGLSAALLVALFPVGIGLVLGTLVVTAALAGWWLGAFRPKREAAIMLLHKTLGQTEYSLPLLTKESLNLAEQLQLERLAQQAAQTPRPVVAFQNLRPYLGILLLAGILFGLIRFWPTTTRKAAGAAQTADVDRQPQRAAAVLPPTFRSACLREQELI